VRRKLSMAGPRWRQSCSQHRWKWSSVVLRQTAWNTLMDAHVTYCSAAGLDIGSGDSHTNMKEKQLIFSEAKMKAEDVLDKEEAEPPDKVQMGTDLKREI
jgi:hypothetical protein